MTTRQIAYTGADGTTVRVRHRPHRHGLDKNEGRPRLPASTVVRHGGFGICPMTPGYSAGLLAWVEAGGVTGRPGCAAAARRARTGTAPACRQQAERVRRRLPRSRRALVADGWTTPDRLAISGGSNGGLLVGAAMTQRPDLLRRGGAARPCSTWCATSCTAWVCRGPASYGDANDPEQLAWLLRYSPHHRVVDRTAYPATSVHGVRPRSRVDPLHARKMCAALQAATTSDASARPVLRREPTSGTAHGA